MSNLIELFAAGSTYRLLVDDSGVRIVGSWDGRAYPPEMIRHLENQLILIEAENLVDVG